jgi:hypothetical protein
VNEVVSFLFRFILHPKHDGVHKLTIRQRRHAFVNGARVAGTPLGKAEQSIAIVALFGCHDLPCFLLSINLFRSIA